MTAASKPAVRALGYGPFAAILAEDKTRRRRVEFFDFMDEVVAADPRPARPRDADRGRLWRARRRLVGQDHKLACIERTVRAGPLVSCEKAHHLMLRNLALDGNRTVFTLRQFKVTVNLR